MARGILYGVGVGPGDPELMTLKAIKTIAHCPCIAAPETADGSMLALKIASGAADLSGKEILPLRFLMTRDPRKLEENHWELAAQLALRLDGGQDVAMLNLGDVSIYSTFAYLMELLQKDGYAVEMVPGVPSFCAVAAALGVGLTTMNEPLHIVPSGGEALEAVLDMPGSKVLMKTGRALPEVRRAVEARGLAERTMLVQDCGLPTEKISRTIREAEEPISYFTTMIIKD